MADGFALTRYSCRSGNLSC